MSALERKKLKYRKGKLLAWAHIASEGQILDSHPVWAGSKKKIETLPMAVEGDCEVTEFSALSPLLTPPFLSTNFVFVVYIIIFKRDHSLSIV